MTTKMQENLPIDVNAASADDLIPIDGIGPALAQRVVQYRQEHGPFASVDELIDVRGIGPSLLERIRAQITVTPQSLQAPPVESPAPTAPLANPSEPEPGALSAPLQKGQGTDLDEPAPLESIAPNVGGDATEEPPELRENTGEEEAVMPEGRMARNPMMEQEISAEELESLEPEMLEPEAVEESEMGETIGEAAEPHAEAGLAKETETPPTPEEGSERIAPQVTAAEAEAGRGFWSGFLLVAGGAVIGALMVLLVLLAYSGTLSYASGSEVDALSHNLDTIYQNSEIAWQRLDRLAAENADLAAKVDRLMQLSSRVVELEQGVGDLRADLGNIESNVAAVESDLESLRETYDRRLDEMDATLAAQSDLLSRMESDLGEVRQAVGDIEERIARYDSFFGALRDLLIDLQGPPASEMGSQAEAEQTPAPAEDEPSA